MYRVKEIKHKKYHYVAFQPQIKFLGLWWNTGVSSLTYGGALFAINQQNRDNKCKVHLAKDI